MRNRARWGWGAAVCTLLSVGYGIADAQTSAGTPAPAPDAAVGMQRQVQLSPQEQLTQGDAFVARMNTSGSSVRRQLEQARTQRDVVKTLCLNDKLNQIDVATRSAHERKTALEQAVARNDVDLSNHEFTILTVLRQRVEQLGAEANQCLGEDVPFAATTQVTTHIDPNIPAQDPTTYPDPPPVNVPSPPTVASPTH